jgi:hypothetical protein
MIVVLVFPTTLFSGYEFRNYYQEVQSKVMEEFCSKYDLVVTGVGGGAYQELTSVDIQFSFRRKVDVDQARLVIVDATETLIQRINEDKRLRPFLAVYPCGLETADVTLTFDKWNQEGKVDSVIDFIFISKKGSLFFEKSRATKDENGSYFDLIHSESYEESRRIVVEQLGPGGAEWIPE